MESTHRRSVCLILPPFHHMHLNTKYAHFLQVIFLVKNVRFNLNTTLKITQYAVVFLLKLKLKVIFHNFCIF